MPIDFFLPEVDLEEGWTLARFSPELLDSCEDDILDIASDIPEEYWTKENFLTPLPEKYRLSLVLAKHGVPRAYLIASEKNDMYYIHHFMVHRDFREHGLGGKLLRASSQIALAHGYSRMGLKVHYKNAKGISFYERAKFATTQEQTGAGNEYNVMEMVLPDRAGVLYIETGELGGGSFESLYQILLNLDRDKYNPVVVYLNDNKYISRLRKLGVACYLLDDILLSLVNVGAMRSFLIRLSGWIYSRLPSFSVVWEKYIHRKLLVNILKISKRHKIKLFHLNNQAERHFFGIIAANKINAACISHLRSPNTAGFNCAKAKYANENVFRFLPFFGDVQKVWRAVGVSHEKSEVLYNAITPFDAEKVDLHERYDIPKKYSFLVGSVGRLMRERAYDFLIKGFAQFAQKYPDAALVIVGPGTDDDFAELKQIATDRNISERVFFTGVDPTASVAIGSFDIFAVAHRQSPFGRIVMEAWCAGAPVVASDVEPIREVIDDRKTALLVPFGDEKSLASAFGEIHDNPELAKSLAENARATVVKKHNMKEYILELQNIYDSAIVANDKANKDND